MKVEINVDETQMKEILEKELKELPKEVLSEVVVESIRGYFEKNNYENVKALFVTEEGYNAWSRRETASPLLRELVNKCDTSKIQGIVDEAIRDVREDHELVIRGVLKEMIVSGMTNQYSFQRAVEEVVNDVFRRRQN